MEHAELIKLYQKQYLPMLYSNHHTQIKNYIFYYKGKQCLKTNFLATMNSQHCPSLTSSVNSPEIFLDNLFNIHKTYQNVIINKKTTKDSIIL